MSYKRNQIEEAIARILEPTSQKPTSELRTRIKRLLQLDRAFGRKPRSSGAEEANFAFFSQDSPGTGADISFTEYEAFALLNGLGLMDHGWPQSLAVSLMRKVRPDLEREHASILSQPPPVLLDYEAVREKARPGDLVNDVANPVFVKIVSNEPRTAEAAKNSSRISICRGLEKAMSFEPNVPGLYMTVFEISVPAHTLRQELTKTAPRRRGRR